MNYYDLNGEDFFKDTANVDMSEHYSEFLKFFSENASILDAGCGSGRDSLNFKNLGFEVTSIDGSKKMCELASEYLKNKVLHMQFQEIEFDNHFDGIWASASLLHVPSSEIEDVLKRLHKSLKSEGIIYASFKYGDFEGKRNGRYFHDLTETTAQKLFEKNDFEVIKTWITHDGRKGRESERWVNILAKKY